MALLTDEDAVRDARSWGDISADTDPVSIREDYRLLVKKLHPDVGGDPALFVKLNELYRRALAPSTPIVMASSKHEYTLGSLLVKGDVANIYAATYDAGRHHVLMKITRTPSNNDLTTNEAKVLTQLVEKGDVRWVPFVSPLVDSFRHRSEDSKDRRVNVFNRIDGFYTLTEVAAEHGQVDARDVAWMWRRLLIAIGFAHDNGFVHASPIMPHVLIHPEKHGLILIGWGHSVKVGEVVRSIPSEPVLWPNEVMDRKPATPALDIYVAAKTMQYLGGARLPTAFRTHLQGCTVLNAFARPQSAWWVLEQFDEMITELWGPRRFHEFRMRGEGRV